jgi:hypothetical protein
MGYRSTVGIAFTRDDPEAPDIPTLIALAKTQGVLEGDGLGKYWDDQDYGWDADKFMFYVGDVKWYEAYPDVQSMEELFRFVESFNTDDKGEDRPWYTGMFCRIGEETNDVEEHSFGEEPWNLVYVTRSLEFDGSLLGNKLTGVNKCD